MKKNVFILFVLTSVLGWAQTPKVPSTMYFGDIKLEINAAGQKKIQSHVDSYRRSPKYFQQKADLANLYFPIIEAKFKEENVPDDFKYLIIQESGFVSDAVSSSNAVGFWQFKEATGKEVGLTINSNADERKNISAASTGAAKYFKFNNQYFSNWIYALQAYLQGAGGTQKDSEPKYYGKKKMPITGKTHWYVLKLLAHKIAYQDAVGKDNNLGFYLQEYKSKGESLKEIAKKQKLDLEKLKEYNKWLSSNRIPTDKDYIVLLTIDGKGTSTTISGGENTKPIPQIAKDVEIDLDKKEVKVTVGKGMPDITIKMKKNAEEQAEYLKNNPHVFARFNGLNTIKANAGDTKDKLALAGGISTAKFLKYNDLKSFTPIIEGHYYYIQNKRNKSKALYHTVKWNETLWKISQDYGVHIKAIRKKNRLDEYHELKAGRVLWMKKTRPKDKKVKFEDPGPKPKPKKKVEKVDLNIKEQDKKLEKEVKEIIKEGVHHNEGEIPNETVHEEVVHDMEDKGVKVLEVKEEIKEPVKEEKNKPSTQMNDDVLIHTVKQGETLYAISKIYKISVEDIMKWNRLKEATVSVDQMLIVGIEAKTDPMPIDVSEKFKIHTVTLGETMYAISKKYNVSVDDILKWNNKKDNSLSEGEKLKIKE